MKNIFGFDELFGLRRRLKTFWGKPLKKKADTELHSVLFF